MYTARYNGRITPHGTQEVELCELESINGDLLATTLILRGDVHDLNNWLRKNKISRDSLVWGSPERDSVLALNPRYGFSQG